MTWETSQRTGKVLEGLQFTVYCEAEDIPIEGNLLCSGDDATDKAAEQATRAELEYNPWAWCSIRVHGEYRGISADAYLGGCSYASGQDFIENSGYFDDMCEEIEQELIDRIEDLSKGLEQAKAKAT